MFQHFILSLICPFHNFTYYSSCSMSSQTTSIGMARALAREMLSSQITLATLATLATVLLVLMLIKHKREMPQCNKELCGLPPGPTALPIIGNMHQMIWNKTGVFRWIHRLIKEMGTEIICLRFGSVHVIAVTCPEMAREVLRKKDAMFASRPTTFASSLFSFGYMSSGQAPHGDQWKKMRRVISTEILSPALERKFHSLREEESDLLVRYIHNTCSSKKTPSDVIDIRHVAQHFCGNMMRRLMFGKRYFREPAAILATSGPGPDEVEHVGALFTLINSVYSFCVSDYFPALVGLDLDGHEKVATGVMRTLNRLHDPIIEARIHEKFVLQIDDKKREARDFLDVLVSLQDYDGQPLLSFDEIRAQTLEIMFAIVENPSNAVEWALAEMINRPEVMQKAVNELDEVVGKDRLVNESDISQLNYLKSCIREAFRMHPYHAFTPPRVAIEDTTIAGYMIPKGSHLLISRIGLGQNTNVWNEPHEFRPERHLKDRDVLLSEPDLRFISFSTGRRGCPATSLGTSVTMMLFARILQGFTWTKPLFVERISLQESNNSLLLEEPLVLCGTLRLAEHLYKSYEI